MEIRNESTGLLDSNLGPLIPLEIRLRQKRQIWYLDPQGFDDNLTNETTAPLSTRNMVIRLNALTYPFPQRKSYFLGELSVLDLDPQTLDFLATRLASFADQRTVSDTRTSIVSEARVTDMMYYDREHQLVYSCSSVDANSWVEGVGGEDFVDIDSMEDIDRAVVDLVESDGPAATASNSNSNSLKRESFNAEDACSVCLEHLSGPNPKQLTKLQCSHTFHESCILSWLDRSTTCPLCRAQVRLPQEDEVEPTDAEDD